MDGKLIMTDEEAKKVDIENLTMYAVEYDVYESIGRKASRSIFDPSVAEMAGDFAIPPYIIACSIIPARLHSAPSGDIAHKNIDFGGQKGEPRATVFFGPCSKYDLYVHAIRHAKEKGYQVSDSISDANVILDDTLNLRGGANSSQHTYADFQTALAGDPF